MKEQLLDIREVAYSREMYAAKPRPFVSAFIYLFLIIIVGAFIWTYMSEIDIVAKGHGVVRPNQNVNTIRVETTGKLQEVNVGEGQQVTQGDVLYVIGHESLLLQKEELMNKSVDIKEKLISLKSYEKSIIGGELAFKESSSYNHYYQTKYKNYQTNLDYLKYQKESTKLQLLQSNQAEVIHSQLKTLGEEYDKMLVIKQSIEQDKNQLVDSDAQGKYEDYTQTIQQYEAEISYLEESLEKARALYEAGIMSKNEYETEAYTLETKKLAFDQYRSNYMVNLEDRIKETEDSISHYEAQLQSAKITEKLLTNEEDNGDFIIEKYRMDTLVRIQNDIKTYKDELDGYEINLKNAILQIERAIIKAPISGKVSLLYETSKEDYISVGTEMLTIIPENETGFSVDIAIPNNEVAGIEVGDVVKFKFSALPFQEYGEFTGTIERISTDIKMEGPGNSYYLVEANLGDVEGVSYKGETRDIKVGMDCEAHVIKEQKKVLYWLLEKIN
jgi:HlyD family secretion protein